MRRLFFLSFLLSLLSFSFAFGMNLEGVKVHLLEGDYKAAILEGEKLLAGSSRGNQSDELYYLLGLSYLKDGNYLRASDIFEIVINEFGDSKFKQEAKMGLGDTYFLRGDFAKAQSNYCALLLEDPGSKLKACLYYRLSQTGFKSSNAEQGNEYLNKLKNEFPQNAELISSQDICLISASSSEMFYTVQVGCFSSNANADNLLKKLVEKSYPAYIENASIAGSTSYRVRVGKVKTRQEVLELESKLSQEGYPTKVFP
jgi:tetratricopeptide (TPR) repeat protein